MKLNIKIWIFILLVCGLGVIGKAQTTGSVSYKLIINDPKQDKIRIENTTLYLYGKKSIELSSNNSLKPISHQVDENSDVKVINQDKPTFILKDFSTKKLVLSDNILLKRYLIADTLLNFKWFITREKKRILNFDCIKATVNFRGRKYEAWFTEDVPIQNGPWKFCGLPGLIIKVKDDKSIFSYELVGIDLKNKFSNKLTSIPESYSNDKEITHSDFIKFFYKKIKDYAKLSKVAYTAKDGSYSGTMTIMLPEKMEKF